MVVLRFEQVKSSAVCMNVTQGLSVGYQNIHGLHDGIGCKAVRLENE